MKQFFLIFAVWVSVQSNAYANQLPTTLQCYTYDYNDASGVRARTHLSKFPIFELSPGRYDSAVPSDQQVLVRTYDEMGMYKKDSSGNVIADQAKASLVLTQEADGHGQIDKTLYVSLLGQSSGAFAIGNIELEQNPAYDGRSFFMFWTNTQARVSCFEPNHLPVRMP